jgi:hypothetical protein
MSRIKHGTKLIKKHCKHHGLTDFYKTSKRCWKCRSEIAKKAKRPARNWYSKHSHFEKRGVCRVCGILDNLNSVDECQPCFKVRRKLIRDGKHIKGSFSTDMRHLKAISLIFRRNNICAICKKPFDTSGLQRKSLDQIAPARGYTPKNVQIVHIHCNQIKSDVTPEFMYKVFRGVLQGRTVSLNIVRNYLGFARKIGKLAATSSPKAPRGFRRTGS